MDQPPFLGAEVVPQRDVWWGSVLALCLVLALKGKQGKSCLLCVIHGGLTDPGSYPSQTPNLVSAGSKPAARMTVFKHWLLRLWKFLGFLAQQNLPVDLGRSNCRLCVLFFLKSQQELLRMENSSFKQLFYCIFFFGKRNVVDEMRGSSESPPAWILQLCWDTSFCFVWIFVMRMKLPLLTFVSLFTFSYFLN